MSGTCMPTRIQEEDDDDEIGAALEHGRRQAFTNGSVCPTLGARTSPVQGKQRDAGGQHRQQQNRTSNKGLVNHNNNINNNNNDNNNRLDSAIAE